MADMVVVRSKIKDYAQDCNVAGDFAEALNEKVIELIKTACKRAQLNGRKTVQARDL